MLKLQRKYSPSRTYALHKDGSGYLINGFVEGKDAVRQDLFLLVSTERGAYSDIYNGFFGVDRVDLIGRDYHYAAVELSERIKDALFMRYGEAFKSAVFKNERINGKVRVTVYADIGY